MVKKRLSQKERVKEYHSAYDHIPKDYMERLAYLYKECKFTKEDLNYLFEQVDRLSEVEWNSVTYIFYMDPKASPRPRLNPNTFSFYVAGAKFNKEIFDEFKEEHSNMEIVIATPCELETKVYIKTPNSMSPREKLAAELELIHHVNKPDWDNLGKSYSDMVQETLVSDDSIVTRGEVQKFYSILPRIEVTVRFMKKYDCKYNKRVIESRKSFKENPKVLHDVPYILE